MPNRIVSIGLGILFLSIPLSISGMQIGLAVAFLGALWDLARGKRLPRTPLDLPILLFLGLTFVSAALSGDPSRGIRQFAGSWTVAGLYLVLGYAQEGDFFRKMMRLLFWPAVIVACYGIFQHFTGMDFIRPDKPLESLEFSGRQVFFPRGAFNHYQTFSNVFFLLFCLSLAQALYNRTGRERPVWIFTALSLGAVLVLSYTRGIWLAAVGAVIFETCFSGRKALATLATVAATAGLLILLSPAGIASRARTIVEVKSNVERFLLWETTWNMIRDYPLLGVGVGNYQRVQAEYIREEVNIPMSRTHSHNNLLQVTVERGVFGLLLFLWMWYVIVKEGFRVLWRLRSDTGYSFALVLGSLTGILGFFFDGLFQNNFGDTEVVMLFWIMVGIVILNSKKYGAYESLSPGAASQ